jgi:hypothetical protein
MVPSLTRPWIEGIGGVRLVRAYSQDVWFAMRFDGPDGGLGGANKMRIGESIEVSVAAGVVRSG